MKLTLATGLVGLVDGLDDTDGDGLPHVTDGETTERWVGVVLLDAHGLAGHKLGNARITRLDELGVRLHDLTRPAIDFLDELGELACDVGGMAVEHWRIACTDLARVVEDDDLSGE